MLFSVKTITLPPPPEIINLYLLVQITSTHSHQLSEGRQCLLDVEDECICLL